MTYVKVLISGLILVLGYAAAYASNDPGTGVICGWIAALVSVAACVFIPGR